MSSRFMAFSVYDSAGDPVDDATPTFLVYKGATGSARTPPTINDLGSGLYGFTIRAEDVTHGIAFFIDNGADTLPRYYAGSEGRVQAFAIYDGSFDPLAGESPTFTSYVDQDGNPATEPTISDFGSGLYAFVPTATQFANGVAFEIDCGAGNNPRRFSGYAQQPEGYDAPIVVGTPEAPTPDDAETQYTRQLKLLLPPGDLWNLDEDSFLTKTLRSIAKEFTRVMQRALDLVEESDPRTATETLDEWERMLGLPDHCVETIPGTTEGRRLAITQKIVKRGGQTPALYIALAAACGYTATIYDDYRLSVFRAGHLCGERCYGVEWAHVFRLDIEAPTGTALTHAELECIINRDKPAHTIALFNYL